MSQDDLDFSTEQTDEFTNASPSLNFDEDEIDEDEQMLAKDEDLPAESGEERGAEEEAFPVVMGVQGNEFVCSVCCLVKHKSQLARMDDGEPICKECARQDNDKN